MTGQGSVYGDNIENLTPFRQSQIQLGEKGYTQVSNSSMANRLLKDQLGFGAEQDVPLSAILNSERNSRVTLSLTDPTADPFGKDYTRVGRIDTGYGWSERGMMGVGNHAIESNLNPTDSGLTEYAPLGPRGHAAGARVQGVALGLEVFNSTLQSFRDTSGEHNLQYRYDVYQHNDTGERKVYVQRYGTDYETRQFGPVFVDKNSAYRYVNKKWYE